MGHVINVGKQKRVELVLNGEECFMSLDIKSIQHFQANAKMGLLKALNKIEKEQDLDLIYTLILSTVKSKKTGAILGKRKLGQYDDFELVSALGTPLMELVGKSMPVADGEEEKK
ncbi:hypothetical protein N2W42_001330 [Clostridium perfringens]|nr:hypothetical protein [Clostridium perfringens]